MVVEVALAVILLAGASLSVRGFAQLLHTDPGFQPERTLMMDVPLPRRRYVTLDQRNNFAIALFIMLRTCPALRPRQSATSARCHLEEGPPAIHRRNP